MSSHGRAVTAASAAAYARVADASSGAPSTVSAPERPTHHAEPPIAAHRGVRVAGLLAVGGGVALALAQTWAAVRAGSMNADGVAYLDIADRYVAGNWADAVNAVWSPLYSWVLAAAMQLAGGRLQEIALVHSTNFAIFALAFASFAFLQHQLSAEIAARPVDERHPLPRWALAAVATLLFFHAALTMITVWAVTPDMLMAAFVCAAAGLVVRIRRGRDGAMTWALLGLALGAGYLAKAVMFPLGFAFLGAALLAAHGRPARRRRVTLSALVFLALSVPWIAIISDHQGRFTFGDAGRLTYLRYVNDIPHPYWYGGTEALGTPAHPPRLVLADPPVHSFGAPADGTYPLSFDPARWYEGAEPRISVGAQARAILTGAVFYYDLFLGTLGVPVACIILLYAVARHGRRGTGERACRFALLLPAVAALGLYALVYVESRYIGVFVLLALLEALAGIRSRGAGRSLATPASVLMVAALATGIAVFHGRGFVALRTNVGAAAAPAAPARPGDVAAALRTAGIGNGDPVGVIGYAFDAFWARAARVRLVAELRAEDAGAVWGGERRVRDDVLSAFGAAGARAVIAEHVPAHANVIDWQRIGESSTYVRLLRPVEGGRQ